jgi:outer membrane protein TolC
MNQSKASLELAKRILETTEIKYREGLANSLEITQNNQQLISAQSNYVASILALMDAKSNLLKTLNQ